MAASSASSARGYPSLPPAQAWQPPSLTSSLDSKEMPHHSSWHAGYWGAGFGLAVESCTVFLPPQD